MKLKIKRLNPDAKLPTRGSKGSAGWDIYYNGDINQWIPPGEFITFECGFALEIPKGHYIAIVPRSSLGRKQILITNSPGTIDEDFRGEFKVMLQNNGFDSYTVNAGDRVAQMILHKYEEMEFEEVEELSSTERGEGGFGSTGK